MAEIVTIPDKIKTSDIPDSELNTIGKFNIYMYDGNHSEDSHFKALDHFFPCLDDEFIYLVDDKRVGVKVEMFEVGSQIGRKNRTIKIGNTNKLN